MNQQGILIVEDEKNLGQTLRDYWRSKGHRVEWAESCKAAQEIVKSMGTELDVVLLDINLPDGNGLELAAKWRKEDRDLVVLFLSAINDPQVRVQGLELGAHDYVTKPFELRELTLRLERILKQRRTTTPAQMRFGKLSFWPRRFEVQDAHGVVTNLAQKEAAILQYFLEHKGATVTRDELIEKIWGEESFPSNRTIDNYIVKLRKWCESDADKPLEITSVRGVGYRVDIKE